ncbi:hypothetical protein BDP27DRAFT_1360992 [Rhodocollybia butyracea]|uniref:Uncharacterized protein n=1 Tax=Rhodocollybia butyracea TaxID=206335 RepID=A0A9P5UBS2_9AGAR|nr:hypothetical protein BDP27DRAFT_1360992 [Rhodocollybia butyracea]
MTSDISAKCLFIYRYLAPPNINCQSDLVSISTGERGLGIWILLRLERGIVIAPGNYTARAVLSLEFMVPDPGNPVKMSLSEAEVKVICQTLAETTDFCVFPLLVETILWDNESALNTENTLLRVIQAITGNICVVLGDMVVCWRYSYALLSHGTNINM